MQSPLFFLSFFRLTTYVTNNKGKSYPTDFGSHLERKGGNMFIIEALGFVILFVIIIALGAFTAASVVLSYIYWIVVAAFSVTAIAALCSRLVRFFKRKARRS